LSRVGAEILDRASKRVVVTRNPKGKVTLAFQQGLASADRGEILGAVEKILKDLR
jgi:hypothetical protein